MTLHTLASLFVTMAIAQATPQTPAPKTTSTTPGACLAEVRGYVSKRTAALAPLPDLTGKTIEEMRALSQTPAMRGRSLAASEISRHRIAMAKECLFEIRRRLRQRTRHRQAARTQWRGRRSRGQRSADDGPAGRARAGVDVAA